MHVSPKGSPLSEPLFSLKKKWNAYIIKVWVVRKFYLLQL